MSPAKWYVDPKSGDDGNDGRSRETLLKTFAQLTKMLGEALTEETEINLLSDSGKTGDPFTFPSHNGVADGRAALDSSTFTGDRRWFAVAKAHRWPQPPRATQERFAQAATLS